MLRLIVFFLFKRLLCCTGRPRIPAAVPIQPGDGLYVQFVSPLGFPKSYEHNIIADAQRPFHEHTVG